MAYTTIPASSGGGLGTLTASVVKSTAGVASAATVGTDYSAASWADQRLIEIQTVDPTITQAYDFNCTNTTDDFATQAATTTGLAIPNTSVVGGALRIKSGTTGGGTQVLRIRDYNATNPPSFVTNQKTSHWAICARVNQQTAVDGGSNIIMAAFVDIAIAADVWVGAFGSISTTNWGVWVNGAGTTKIDTLIATDVGNWHNIAIINNGSVLTFMLDGVAAPTTTAITNLATGPAGDFRIQCTNNSLTNNREFWMSRYAICTPASP